MTDKSSLYLDLDRETTEEVLYEFDRHHIMIEDLIAASNHLSDDNSLQLILHEVHSVRENAAMVQLLEIMSYTNAVENVIFSIINNNLPTSQALTEIVLMSLDRLRDLHHVYLSEAEFDNLNAENIENALAALSIGHNQNNIESAIDKVLFELTNQFTEEYGDASSVIHEEHITITDPFTLCSESEREDLAVFRNMALQIDNQCIFWRNRSDALCHWAMAINDAAGKPIDCKQLAAAVFLHDTGMAFLANAILNKSEKLDSHEWNQLQFHPIWGFEIVVRMPGWATAAQMIQQHHEREDGQGYPHRLHAHEICEGAKLIAILDAFFAMTKPRADRPRRRSILRAISEINACAGQQFSKEWVDYFNVAMKQDMKDGLLLQISMEESN